MARADMINLALPGGWAEAILCEYSEKMIFLVETHRPRAR